MEHPAWNEVGLTKVRTNVAHPKHVAIMLVVISEPIGVVLEPTGHQKMIPVKGTLIPQRHAGTGWIPTRQARLIELEQFAVRRIRHRRPFVDMLATRRTPELDDTPAA